MDVQADILPSGNLLLTVDAESQAELAEALESGPSYWGAVAELFESYSCNGSYTPFDAGQGNPFVGLTCAPCIAEELCHDDDGEAEIVGRFWFAADYQIRDPFRELAESGRVEFQLATESGS